LEAGNLSLQLERNFPERFCVIVSISCFYLAFVFEILELRVIG
jgi:hypothetical protein